MGYLVYGRHFEGNLKVKCKGKMKECAVYATDKIVNQRGGCFGR